MYGQNRELVRAKEQDLARETRNRRWVGELRGGPEAGRVAVDLPPPATLDPSYSFLHHDTGSRRTGSAAARFHLRRRQPVGSAQVTMPMRATVLGQRPDAVRFPGVMPEQARQQQVLVRTRSQPQLPPRPLVERLERLGGRRLPVDQAHLGQSSAGHEQGQQVWQGRQGDPRLAVDGRPVPPARPWSSRPRP